MEEHNKKTLIEALSSLKEYEPSEEVWRNIQNSVRDDDAISPKNALLKLPEYNPAPSIWEAIEKKLEQPLPTTGRVVPLGWKKILAVAASVALLIFSVYWLNSEIADKEDYTLTYSTEAFDPMLAVQDWDEDEPAFQQFLELCEAKQYVCEQPAFTQLRSELEELTAAKEALKEAVGSYGADASLVTQIKEIELERTDLLKKMMVMLI